jgi:hypothetical protein
MQISLFQNTLVLVDKLKTNFLIPERNVCHRAFPSNIVYISVTQHPCGKSPCTSIFTKTNRNTLMRSMFDYQIIYLWKQDKNTKEIKQNNNLLYILLKTYK